MQVPCPARVNVQIFDAWIKLAFPAVWRERQSALVKVCVFKNCKLFVEDPGWAVCPQPDTWALTAPWLADANGMARVAAFMVMVPLTCTVEMSLARVFELYDPWFLTAEAWNNCPPVVRLLDPTRTLVFAADLPMVQWAAEPTHLLLMINPPQKWAFAFDWREAWWGNALPGAAEPPTIRPSHSA